MKLLPKIENIRIKHRITQILSVSSGIGVFVTIIGIIWGIYSEIIIPHYSQLLENPILRLIVPITFLLGGMYLSIMGSALTINYITKLQT